MAQIARKLPSEVKPRMVNCDLGHSLFMAEGRIKFFCGCGDKKRLCWTRSVREIRAFGPQTRKDYFIKSICQNIFKFIFAKIQDSAFLVKITFHS